MPLERPKSVSSAGRHRKDWLLTGSTLPPPSRRCSRASKLYNDSQYILHVCNVVHAALRKRDHCHVWTRNSLQTLYMKDHKNYRS
jgi:hypothetical protein